MLAHRLQCCSNIKPALIQYVGLLVTRLSWQPLWQLEPGAHTVWWTIKSHLRLHAYDSLHNEEGSRITSPANTKHLYNVGPTSKTLGRRCINVIQMFCAYWDDTCNVLNRIPTSHSVSGEGGSRHGVIGELNPGILHSQLIEKIKTCRSIYFIMLYLPKWRILEPDM